MYPTKYDETVNPASSETPAVPQALTFSPFIDPAGMLGFLLLTSPERVGFLDGKEAF